MYRNLYFFFCFCPQLLLFCSFILYLLFVFHFLSSLFYVKRFQKDFNIAETKIHTWRQYLNITEYHNQMWLIQSWFFFYVYCMYSEKCRFEGHKQCLGISTDSKKRFCKHILMPKWPIEFGYFNDKKANQWDRSRDGTWISSMCFITWFVRVMTCDESIFFRKVWLYIDRSGTDPPMIMVKLPWESTGVEKSEEICFTCVCERRFQRRSKYSQSNRKKISTLRISVWGCQFRSKNHNHWWEIFYHASCGRPCLGLRLYHFSIQANYFNNNWSHWHCIQYCNAPSFQYTCISLIISFSQGWRGWRILAKVKQYCQNRAYRMCNFN